MMQDKVTIGRRGIITIPAKMREAFGLKEQDELIIEDTGQGLLLRPALSVPIEMYTEERIAEFARDEKAIGRVLRRSKPHSAT
jgi:AbrB family looped-hinge helix DNA binding protein